MPLPTMISDLFKRQSKPSGPSLWALLADAHRQAANPNYEEEAAARLASGNLSPSQEAFARRMQIDFDAPTYGKKVGDVIIGS